MTVDAEEWLERYAALLGAEAPDAGEVAAVLDLAGVAARASERRSAPVSAWMAARAGLTAEEALALAVRLADGLDGP